MQCLLPVFCWWCAGSTKPSEDDIGTSPGYKLASKMMRESINFSVDPCQDFYEFTCGNWIKNNPIPGHHITYSQYTKLGDKVEKELKELFESQERYDSKVMNGLKIHYKKCMDIKEQNRIGAWQMIRKLNKFGVWPILHGDDKWNRKNFDLTSLLSFVSRLRRVDLFVNYKLTTDERNTSRRLLEFTQGGLSLPGRIYLNKYANGDKIDIFREFLVKKVMLYQEDGNFLTNRKKTEKDVDEVIELETDIAKIRGGASNEYNLHRFGNLRKHMPLIDWDRFFREVAPADAHPYFKSDPLILVRQPDYLKRLNELLKYKDPRIITNYVFLRFSSILTKEMGERYEDVTQDYMREMYGRQEKAPRWKECTKSTKDLLKYATGAIYIKKAFDKKALYKAEKMLGLVAYPDFILDAKKLDEQYEGLNIDDNDSYAKLMEKVARFGIKYIFKRLMESVDRSEYDFNPAAVNGYYFTLANTIRLPAAVLQAPFFHHTFPRAFNYGGLGSIIGHEITHGFDDEGRQFDAHGNLQNWWDSFVEREFEKRAQCFVNQYNKIEVPGTNQRINGEQTLGENIADNGGLKEAYRAYKAYLQRHGGKEQRIEGLETFDNDQMFFIGYASVWCEHTTQQRLINQISTDEHSPARYRVNQVLANQPEFARAFKCGRGTPMNPRYYERCAVW
ncbi:unnamed protein product [Cylicocyclus nassatus]|uniref:Uncharacterized protein n=1 Tax=Cylicocyclus nassatus TaxID=53992 RepID=A0AA36MFV7_CYLNA|nr:unnamed protein product [Cylicocyclus nassatus]